MAIDIFWSPSSQQANLYAYGNTNEEVVMNAIVDRADYHAKRHGYTTARNVTGESYAQHRDRSNTLKPRFHVAPHSNAGTGIGSTMYCFKPSDLARLSTILSTNMYNELVAVTGVAGRGIRQGTFDEIVNVDAAVAYPEIDYHDKPDRAQWILEHKEEIAIGIVKSILKTDNKAWIDEVIVVELPAPDLQATVNEKDAIIAQLNNQIATLSNQVDVLTTENTRLTAINEDYHGDLVEVARAFDVLARVADEF